MGETKAVLVLRCFWRSMVAVLVLAVGSLLTPIMATADASSGTVIVSASIAPVREVLVDKQQRILQIDSNTTQAVAPTMYVGSFTNVPQPLSPTVAEQYKTIMATKSTHPIGVIYTYNPVVASHSNNNSFSTLARLISLTIRY